MSGDEFLLNSNHIETVEAKPDTTITMTNERKYLVRESVDEILEMIRTYQRSLLFPEGD